MDILNQTSSESFQIQQLSAVGDQWEISLLQPFDVIFPSNSLFTGQALSCFFILKVGSLYFPPYLCLRNEWCPFVVNIKKKHAFYNSCDLCSNA